MNGCGKAGDSSRDLDEWIRQPVAHRTAFAAAFGIKPTQFDQVLDRNGIDQETHHDVTLPLAVSGAAHALGIRAGMAFRPDFVGGRWQRHRTTSQADASFSRGCDSSPGGHSASRRPLSLRNPPHRALGAQIPASPCLSAGFGCPK
jgi:hypothetical protein